MGITSVFRLTSNTVNPMFSSSSAASSSSSARPRGSMTSNPAMGRPTTTETQSQRSRDACNSCKVKFSSSVLNLIMKKTCPSCQKLVCPSCIVFTLKIPKSIYMCKKCVKLSTFNYEPRHLMRLHGKELREILSAMDIPYVDGSEKSELVQLILRHRGGDSWRPSHPEPPPGRTPTTCDPQAAPLPREAYSGTDERAVPTAPPLDEEGEEAHEEKSDDGPREEGEAAPEERREEQQAQPLPPSSLSPPVSPRLRSDINLNEIETESEIESLSIRQLKSILVRNSVDYKGCCEKWELAARVTKLWNSAKKSNVDIETLSEDEICKICMNAPIDCVMLECGHMATCTRCGRQMNECPICRQYVVRVVRTFKA